MTHLLTLGEIQILSLILTGKKFCGGEYYPHAGLKKLKNKENSGVSLQPKKGSKPPPRGHMVVAQAPVQSLAYHNLIYLTPAIGGNRYRYDGIWRIHKENFRNHPQYNEVRMQIALGIL